MKKKLKMMVYVAIAIIVTTFSVPSVLAQSIDNNMTVITSDVNSVESRAYIRGWRYKVMDGHFYKRLYNYSTQQWETDWILVE